MGLNDPDDDCHTGPPTTVMEGFCLDLNEKTSKIGPEIFHVFGTKGKITNPKKVKGSSNLPTIIFEGAI